MVIIHLIRLITVDMAIEGDSVVAMAADIEEDMGEDMGDFGVVTAVALVEVMVAALEAVMAVVDVDKL